MVDERPEPDKTPEPPPFVDESQLKHARRESLKRDRIMQRREQVVKLMPYRLTQEEMGRELGVKASTIMTDIKAIRKMWQERFLVRYDTFRAEELAILDGDERNWRTQLQRALLGKKKRVELPDGTFKDEWEVVPDRDAALGIQDRVMAIMRMKMELSGLRGGQPGPLPMMRESQGGPMLSDQELAHRLLSAFQMGRIRKEDMEGARLLPEPDVIIDVISKPIEEQEPAAAESSVADDEQGDGLGDE